MPKVKLIAWVVYFFPKNYFCIFILLLLFIYTFALLPCFVQIYY